MRKHKPNAPPEREPSIQVKEILERTHAAILSAYELGEADGRHTGFELGYENGLAAGKVVAENTAAVR